VGSHYSTSYTDTNVSEGVTYSYRVQAVNSYGTSDYSNTLTVTCGEEDSITITSPNGGEDWKLGSTHNITWSSQGDPGSYVKIRLYMGGSFESTITSSTDNDGSYSWTIPADQTTDSEYKIRITSTNNSSCDDYSDDYFTISGEGYSIKTENTDSGGEATFIDDSTGGEVIIRVVDANNNTPLQDMCVIFTDGDGFEKFVVDDPTNTYFPSIAFYEHNSPHEIKMTPVVTKNYRIDFIEASGAETAKKAIASVFYNPYCEPTNVAEVYYVDHLTGEEFAARREFGRGIIIFVLTHSGIPPLVIAGNIADNLDDVLEDVLVYNGERIPIKSLNWDWYRVKYDLINAQGEIYSVNHWESVFIPSQYPTVNIGEVEVLDNTVTVSWTGNDSTEYSEVGLPAIADATVTCEGLTTGPDLTYSYRITKDGVVYNGFDWTNYSSDTSASFTIDDDGTYTFEIKVKDDVENVGTDSSEFSIGGESGVNYPNTEIDTIWVGYSPEGVAVTPNGSYVYVANAYYDTVSVIQTSDNTVVGDPVSVGDFPYGVAITPNGSYVYVANGYDGTVSVIQTSDNTVVGNPISVGNGPRGIAVTPNGSYVYVANWYDYTVSVIQTSDNTVIDTISVSICASGAAVTPNGSYVYVTSGSCSHTVSVIGFP